VSTLVILMCLAGMTDCTAQTAPLVIRKEMTSADCARYVEIILPLIRAGRYESPRGGWYVLRCEPVEPAA
jgi:hypothetical protein